ncbi:MAG TPA: hypothetical protein VFB72_15565 [Verrucomicrobiae bacterium]|nr:hypothetical protein [Verrucomicrobiae bacterium]
MITIAPTSTFADFTSHLREFIGSRDLARFVAGTRADDAVFNRLALALFSMQFSEIAPYRKFCEARKVTPEKLKHWSEIPAMLTAGFKELELTSLLVGQRTHVFHSSGTTEQRPSRHFHSADSLALYEASLLAWFEANFLNSGDTETSDDEAHRWLFLTPSARQATHSSLVHMFHCIRCRFGSNNSLFTGFVKGDGIWEVDLNATVNALREAIAKKQRVMLFGTAFNFVHLLDHLDENGLSLRLPADSRVLETGGYKGRSRALAKTELHALITRLLGIPASHIICEYGMSELSSQAYDIARSKSTARVFQFPPWARAQIISPETGCEVGEGGTGLIRIFDLANVYSVMAIQTEDLGVRCGAGFELLGRAAISEPRGCSLMSR